MNAVRIRKPGKTPQVFDLVRRSEEEPSGLVVLVVKPAMGSVQDLYRPALNDRRRSKPNGHRN